MIDDATVCYYQTAGQEIMNQIDTERAKSEVAFIDEETNQTIYGVDAFLTIFKQDNRFLNWLFKVAPIHWIASKVYRFTSFNRHVIAGIPPKEGERDCTPQAHKAYRWMYIILGAIITSIVLSQFSFLLASQLGVDFPAYQEWLICFGQIAWQLIAIHIINKQKRLDYLGNMTTVSIIGALLMIPLLIFNWMGTLNYLQLLIYFSVVVAYMFLLHLKRSKNLQLPLSISMSWIIYRTLLLLIIISLQIF
jgi:predicted DCC family thiol-disulfide oxidoreductase YuxK